VYQKAHGESSIGQAVSAINMPPIAWDNRARAGARNHTGAFSFEAYMCPMCDGHGRLEYAPDVPEWYMLSLTGPAIGKILEFEACDPRSIAELMILASHSDRGRQEALFCVHQLLKCPPPNNMRG
jgi:hypothetical protein